MTSLKLQVRHFFHSYKVTNTEAEFKEFKSRC